MDDEAPATRFALRHFTVLGVLPPGDRQRMRVVGDEYGQLSLVTTGVIANMPEAFKGQPIFVEPNGVLGEPSVVRIPKYTDNPSADPTYVNVEYRTVELSPVGSPEEGWMVTCAFDAPTRQWFVCGRVRAFPRQ